MIQTDEAIVLKRRDLRETSLYLVFYTKGFGKICGVMKGVRGQRGQYSATPQLFTLNEIVFYENRAKDIFIVSGCELRDFFAPIREDLEKTSYASYFVELINSLSPACEKNTQMFELLSNSLRLLCGSASVKRVARVFEIKLLALLGLMPQLESCVGCGSEKLSRNTFFSLKNGGVVCEPCAQKEKNCLPISTGSLNFMGHISRSSWELVPRIKVSAEVGREIEQVLRRFFDYHLDLRPKSVEFMRKALV